MTSPDQGSLRQPRTENTIHQYMYLKRTMLQRRKICRAKCRPFAGAAEWYLSVVTCTQIIIVRPNANHNLNPDLETKPNPNSDHNLSLSPNFHRSSKWMAHSGVEFPPFEISSFKTVNFTSTEIKFNL